MQTHRAERVIDGNERVVRARLDAKFFFEEGLEAYA